MAISTYKTFLMHGTKGSGSTITWAKLVDITQSADMGGEPEQIEITTLSQKMKTFINGLQNTESMPFECNYDKSEFTALKALENKTEHYALWLGGTEGDDGKVTPTGEDGKWSWEGQLSCYLKSGGVNNAHKVQVTISASSVITFE